MPATPLFQPNYPPANLLVCPECKGRHMKMLGSSTPFQGDLRLAFQCYICEKVSFLSIVQDGHLVLFMWHDRQSFKKEQEKARFFERENAWMYDDE